MGKVTDKMYNVLSSACPNGFEANFSAHLHI
jgi:hypothetical protein